MCPRRSGAAAGAEAGHARPCASGRRRGRPRCEDCGHRTRALFERGRPVCDGVRGRLRYELRATWLGGTRILERLERARFDVFDRRPALGAPDG